MRFVRGRLVPVVLALALPVLLLSAPVWLQSTPALDELVEQADVDAVADSASGHLFDRPGPALHCHRDIVSTYRADLERLRRWGS